MTWDEAITTTGLATNTSTEYVKRAAEDLVRYLGYRKRVTLDSPLPPVTWDTCTAMAEKWDQVEKFNKTLCDGWGFDPSNGTLVKLEHNKEEIMDYSACYKEKKEMLFPEMDWYQPDRMTNYYFRMPVEMRIDGRKLRNDPTQFRPDIKKIIFNDPATIILWNDGTKTVVKCGPDDVYDPEKGYVMCLLKRFCGNDTAMFHKFLKYGMKNYILKEVPADDQKDDKVPESGETDKKED